jgi:hypothetical protein
MKKKPGWVPGYQLEGTINKPSRGEQLTAAVAGRRRIATASNQLVMI